MALWIIGGVVLLLILLAALGYNGLIAKRNRAANAWSQVDVQLRRRYDLIPNLVEAVKGYAAHESQTFDAVTQARAAAENAKGPAAQGQAEAALSGALGRLMAVAENYPQLRATENFQKLQNELTETEDEIQASRRIYNSNVQSYNTKIQVFPNSLIANSGGFTPREFFEISDAAEREPVQVSFSQPPAQPAS